MSRGLREGADSLMPWLEFQGILHISQGELQ